MYLFTYLPIYSFIYLSVYLFTDQTTHYHLLGVEAWGLSLTKNLAGYRVKIVNLFRKKRDNHRFSA
jgi:hypothetical protein